MSTPMTPDRAYDALGLDENTPRKEIRKAYFRLALKHHPDKAKDEQAKQRANEHFRDIQSAYETLTQDHDGEGQPTLDALKRRQAEPSSAWMEYLNRSGGRTDYEAYGEEDEEEETDDVRYGGATEDEDEMDGEDEDRRCRSDVEDGDDDEGGVWPTVEMRTTGYIDPKYGEKKTISGDAPKRLVIGDGVKHVAEKEEWEDFRATVDDTPFVFEPPPYRRTIQGNGSILPSKQAIRINRPPTKSSSIQSEPLTSRIMPRGLPRVIGMKKDGQPIHEGEDHNTVRLRGNYLTASQYNQLTRPQTAGRTIANEIAYRDSSIREIKVLACQECFPGMGQWTVEERDFNGRNPVCGNCRGELEKIVVGGEDGSGSDVRGMFLGDGVEREVSTGGDVAGISFVDALKALSGEGGGRKLADSATTEAMLLE